MAQNYFLSIWNKKSSSFSPNMCIGTCYMFFLHSSSLLYFQKCSETKVSDKRVYNTFARTLPPSSKVSKSVVALLKAFHWHRFVVVSGSHPASGSEVQEALEVCIVNFNSYILWPRLNDFIQIIDEVCEVCYKTGKMFLCIFL